MSALVANTEKRGRDRWHGFKVFLFPFSFLSLWHETAMCYPAIGRIDRRDNNAEKETDMSVVRNPDSREMRRVPDSRGLWHLIF